MGLTKVSLWNKSKVFLERGIACRNAGEFEQFQLWAIMALEVLGKAALAHIHPALVADPQDFESLLASCGVSKTLDFRTIQAKTVFSRCKRVVKGFDETCERFCLQMATDRNAELHSGSTPLSGVPIEKWQPKFWQCVRLLTEAQEQTLETLLGEHEATMAEEIVEDASQAIVAAVKGRIDRARNAFAEGQSDSERKHVAAAAQMAVRAQIDEESLEEECPACGCIGILRGDLAEEEVGEPDDDEPWLRLVTQSYSAEEFRCVACRLHLEGEVELIAGEISTDFQKTNVQEFYDEEDYGND